MKTCISGIAKCVGEYWGFLVFTISLLFLIFYLISIPYLIFTQTVTDETGNPTTTHSEMQSTKNISPESSQQLSQITDFIIARSADDSKAISNLTNEIYYLTVFVMAITFLASIFMFVFQHRQERIIKEWVTDKAVYLEKANERLRQDLQQGIQNKINDILMQEISEQVNGYGKLLSKQMAKQSDKHEERLYHIEQVRLEQLKQGDVPEWMRKLQEDYFDLLKLISPKEQETFEALDNFRKRDDLPYSFSELLRFLDKQDRLPGASRILAMSILQDKFGELLDG